MKIVKIVRDLIEAYRKLQKYMRHIGVNFTGEGKVIMYGNPMKMFGSEPWLVT